MTRRTELREREEAADQPMTPRRRKEESGDEPQFVQKESVEAIRKKLLEHWKHAPATIEAYNPGMGHDEEGNPYEYGGGGRLIINGEHVMDDCEIALWIATVNMMFKGIEPDNVDNNFSTLTLGAGLLKTESLVAHKLHALGKGQLHIVELNEQVADWTQEWVDKEMEQIRKEHLNIKIFLHRGDATEVTRRLVYDEGLRFDMMFSDTYPIGEARGDNDLRDMDTKKRGLKGFKRFAWCQPYQGRTNEFTPLQTKVLRDDFRNASLESVPIKPPPDYKFTQIGKDKNGYMRSRTSALAIACSNPQF